MIVTGFVVPVSPALASASACTPSVSLAPITTDAAGVTHYVMTYRTCGPEMALKLKSRVYHEGRYEAFITGPVTGSGQTEYTEFSCGGQSVKGQWLATLKIKSVLYATSTPQTYTIPNRACT